jgi:hypothetical protein
MALVSWLFDLVFLNASLNDRVMCGLGGGGRGSGSMTVERKKWAGLPTKGDGQTTTSRESPFLG